MPCRISIALSGGGHRAAAWALGTLYGLLAIRDAEARKDDGGVPIEFTAVASVSGGSLTNGVLATGLADLGVDLDDVTLDDFRRVTGRLLTTVATTGLIPAKGPTRRYLTGALAVLTLTVAAAVATVVAVCTARAGRPGWPGCCRSGWGSGHSWGSASRWRCGTSVRSWRCSSSPRPAHSRGSTWVTATATRRGSRCWRCWSARSCCSWCSSSSIAARGRVFERALDAVLFRGRRLATCTRPTPAT